MDPNFSEDDFKIKTQTEQQKFVDLHHIDLKEIMDLWDTYATKKTATAGFFNLALMSTNFAQLKNLSRHKIDLSAVDIIIMVAICISLLLQVLAGVVLVFLGKNTISNDKFKMILLKNNDLVTIMVFAIFIINIFINVFTMIE